MGGLVRGLRFAVGSLIRGPGFTVPALSILALGMTAATAIFTVVDSIVFRPLDYPAASRLVLVCEDHARLQGPPLARPFDFRFRPLGIDEGRPGAPFR